MDDLIDEVEKRTEGVLGNRSREEVIEWLRRMNKPPAEWIAMDDRIQAELAAYDANPPPEMPDNAPEWYKHKWCAPDGAPPPGPVDKPGELTVEELVGIFRRASSHC